MNKEIFHIGDVADGCPDVHDLSCDLVITSPPYFKRNGYSDELINSLGDVMGRTLKPGGRGYVIVGQTKEKLDRPFDAQREILAGGDKRLAPGQTIIWVKSIAVGGWVEQCPACDHKYRPEVVSHGHFQPINSEHLFNYCWEYVLSFIKKPVKDSYVLNRKGIGVAYADKTNIKRWKNAADALHCPGDIWFIPYGTTGSSIKKVHRHEFPQELARRLIVGSGIPVGAMVFDPFVGGGTTPLTAAQQGMGACGYDINKNSINALRREWRLGITQVSIAK